MTHQPDFTVELQALRAQLEEDLRAFRTTLEGVRSHMAQVASTPVHTPEERQQLHNDAASGRLGPEMRELARRVDAGDTTWADVFEGESPYSELLTGHLDAMVEEYADDWKAELERDPEVGDEVRANAGSWQEFRDATEPPA